MNNKKLSADTKKFLTRVNAIWRWTGNAHQWGQWLLLKGAADEVIMGLANRIAQNKIQNPWSMLEIAHIITQNVNEQRHAAASKKQQVGKDKAPTLLSDIFKKAGMNR